MSFYSFPNSRNAVFTTYQFRSALLRISKFSCIFTYKQSGVSISYQILGQAKVLIKALNVCNIVQQMPQIYLKTLVSCYKLRNFGEKKSYRFCLVNKFFIFYFGCRGNFTNQLTVLCLVYSLFVRNDIKLTSLLYKNGNKANCRIVDFSV